MNKTILAALAALAIAPGAGARLTVANGMMHFNAEVQTSGLLPKSTGSAAITPVIITADGDSIELSPVAVYGRRSLINHRRTGTPLAARAYNKADVPARLTLADSIPFTPALSGARAALKIEEFGCANCLKKTSWTDFPEVWEMPGLNIADHLRFDCPQASASKETSLSGSAYVQFPVNSTRLLPDFRNNTAELAKILAVIDSVKSDPDITLTAIAIKGYASPEGSWSSNARLAEGRTLALKGYVEGLYSLPSGFIKTEWEAEDWQGLRKAVEAMTDLDDRAGVLSIIDQQGLDPDTRDHRIRADYPRAYARLLQEVYPTLRHSDYRVGYTIRSFSTPEEILQVMASNPAKLSPEEFYVAAASLTPGSPEFRNVWETAARRFPTDETAQINAAQAALLAGDLAAARAFLNKAGSGDAADHARALLAIAEDDYATAARLIKNDPELLRQVNEILNLKK